MKSQFLGGFNLHFQASIHIYPWLTLPFPYPSHAWFPCPKIIIIFPIKKQHFRGVPHLQSTWHFHWIPIRFPWNHCKITIFQHLEGIFPDFPIFSLGFPYDFPMPNLGSQATSGSAPCHLVPSRGPTWTVPTWAPRNGGSRPGSPSAMWGLSHEKLDDLWWIEDGP